MRNPVASARRLRAYQDVDLGRTVRADMLRRGYFMWPSFTRGPHDLRLVKGSLELAGLIEVRWADGRGDEGVSYYAPGQLLYAARPGRD